MAEPSPEPSSRPLDGELGVLFERCWPRLRARIRLMLGEGARRELDTGDLLGDVSVRILRRLAELQVTSESQLLRLGTHIARHLIIDELRRPAARRFESVTAALIRGEAPSGSRTPSHEVAQAEDVETMFRALEQLPVAHREVIRGRDFEGRSFAEIARDMGSTENAVQLLHKRALRRLGSLLRS